LEDNGSGGGEWKEAVSVLWQRLRQRMRVGPVCIPAYGVYIMHAGRCLGKRCAGTLTSTAPSNFDVFAIPHSG
jgi:hypothetical protein